MKGKICRNPRCADDIADDRIVPLCASCRLIGKVGMALGALLAGALVKFFG